MSMKDTGTHQRFIYLNGTDPTLPMNPEPFDLSEVDIKYIKALPPGTNKYIEVDEGVADQVRKRHWSRLTGSPVEGLTYFEGLPNDGHLALNMLRTAAVLSVVCGANEPVVDDDTFNMAREVFLWSEYTKAEVLKASGSGESKAIQERAGNQAALQRGMRSNDAAFNKRMQTYSDKVIDRYRGEEITEAVIEHMVGKQTYANFTGKFKQTIWDSLVGYDFMVHTGVNREGNDTYLVN